jgi:hypothetical protein
MIDHRLLQNLNHASGYDELYTNQNNIWSFLTSFSNYYAAWGCIIQQEASDLGVNSFGFNHPISSCNMVLYPLR